MLFYGKQLLCRLDKDCLSALLSDLQKDDTKLVEKPKKKKIKKLPDNVSDRYLKAKQLALAYAKLKKEVFRTKSVIEIAKGNPKFQHFLKAVDIMDQHGCSNFKTYLLSQIDGLKGINGGKGVFPSPGQLDTEAAETRLLQYLAETRDDSGATINVQLSDEDKNTPLTGNLRYLARRDRVKNGTAKLEEAVYVKLCQLHRRGTVDDYVIEFLNEISGN